MSQTANEAVLTACCATAAALQTIHVGFLPCGDGSVGIEFTGNRTETVVNIPDERLRRSRVVSSVDRAACPLQIGGSRVARVGSTSLQLADHHAVVEDVLARYRRGSCGYLRLASQAVRAVEELTGVARANALDQSILAVPSVGSAPACQRISIRVIGVTGGRAARCPSEQHIRRVDGVGFIAACAVGLGDAIACVIKPVGLVLVGVAVGHIVETIVLVVAILLGHGVHTAAWQANGLSVLRAQSGVGVGRVLVVGNVGGRPHGLLLTGHRADPMPGLLPGEKAEGRVIRVHRLREGGRETAPCRVGRSRAETLVEARSHEASHGVGVDFHLSHRPAAVALVLQCHQTGSKAVGVIFGQERIGAVIAGGCAGKVGIVPIPPHSAARQGHGCPLAHFAIRVEERSRGRVADTAHPVIACLIRQIRCATCVRNPIQPSVLFVLVRDRFRRCIAGSGERGTRRLTEIVVTKRRSLSGRVNGFGDPPCLIVLHSCPAVEFARPRVLHHFRQIAPLRCAAVGNGRIGTCRRKTAVMKLGDAAFGVGLGELLSCRIVGVLVHLLSGVGIGRRRDHCQHTAFVARCRNGSNVGFCAGLVPHIKRRGALEALGHIARRRRQILRDRFLLKVLAGVVVLGLFPPAHPCIGGVFLPVLILLSLHIVV